MLLSSAKNVRLIISSSNMLRKFVFHFGKELLPKTVSGNFIQHGCVHRLFSSKVNTLKPESLNVEVDSRLLPFMETANRIGLKTISINYAVKNNPYILDINSEQLCKNCTLLSQFGFEPDMITDILIDNPYLFSLKSTNLQNVLLKWMNVNIESDLVVAILANNPHLISNPSKEIIKRFEDLLPYLNSYKNVGRLVLKTPDVLFENWELLKEKLSYLRNLYISPDHIITSNSMRLDILEIKMRFAFLKRAGLYKEFNPKKKYKNPHTSKILGTDRKYFAEKVVGLELEEYDAFSELFKLEFVDEEELDEYDSE